MIQNSTDTVAEGIEDVGCPTVTEWVTPVGQGGGGFGIKFNGQGKDEIIGEHEAVDKQVKNIKTTKTYQNYSAVLIG